MLLMRELLRVLRNVTGFSLATGRVWILVAVVLIAAVALFTTSVTVVGPLAIYPFL